MARITYANNFVCPIAAAKAPAVSTIRVAATANSTLFSDAFGATVNTGQITVPVTVLDSAGAVLGIGHVLSWDTFAVGSEGVLNVCADLTALDIPAGCSLASRVHAKWARPDMNSAYRTEFSPVAPVAYYLNTCGEYVHVNVAPAATTVTLYPPDSHGFWDTTDMAAMANAQRHFVVTAYETNGTGITTGGIQVVGHNYDAVHWEGGVAPSFSSGYPRLHIELWLCDTYHWMGRWFRTA